MVTSPLTVTKLQCLLPDLLLATLLIGIRCGRPFGTPMWVKRDPLEVGPLITMVRPTELLETQGNGRVGLMVSGARIGNIRRWQQCERCLRLEEASPLYASRMTCLPLNLGRTALTVQRVRLLRRWRVALSTVCSRRCGSRLVVDGMVTFELTWCPRLVMWITKNLLRPEVKTVVKPVCLSRGTLLPLVYLSMCRPNPS